MRSAIFLAALATLAGCKAMDQDPTLEPFSDCEDMRGYMARMATREARAEHTHSFVIGMGLGCGSGDAEYDDSDGYWDTDSQGGSSVSYASNYSSTNVQEHGVDEADLVKTDGRHLYALVDEWLVTSVGWPLEEAEETSRVALDGSPRGIYLFDDTIAAISSQGSGGLVTLLDASDPEVPVVIRKTFVDGEVRSSRRIGETLYLVSYRDVEVASPHADLATIREEVEDATPEDWLPHTTDQSLVDGQMVSTYSGTSFDCSDVYWSRRETGTFMTTVMSLDLTAPGSPFVGEAVVGRADTIYASLQGLYVAYSEEPDGPFRSLDPQLDTVIHKFDISAGADKPTFVDTVQLPGVLTNQFAMSERFGVLRTATSDPTTDTTDVWTLGEEDGRLERLGHLGGLAPGEELYAVRFVKDLGYLVTYEVAENRVAAMQIPFGDPLFTIDLSDPSSPRALGELVMNGWSDYIHPLGDHHLITVGMDEGDGGTWGVAISLFDVSDLSEPVLADREVLEALSSEAQTEHHAFNYFAEQSALALPIRTLDGEWALQVLSVDTEGVDVVGQLVQSTVDAAVDNDEFVEAEWECTRIRRSVMMEDKVWAVGRGGLTAAALSEPEVELAAVPFTGIGQCGWTE